MLQRIPSGADFEETKKIVNLLLGDIETMFLQVRSQIIENFKLIEKNKEE